MRRAIADRQRGAVAVMTGLVIAVLIGFLGLAVDLGRLFVIKSELQTGMDACALAAATQLRPGLNDPNAYDRVVAFGRTPPNRVNFQGTAIEPTAIQFTFAQELAGPYTAGGFANASYVRCTYPLNDIPVFFVRVLTAISESTVAATAVATLSPAQSNCGFPVAVCRAPGATGPNWGLAPGQWVSGLADPGGGSGIEGCGSGTGTGNFCWVGFTSKTSNTKSMSDLIAGPGLCDLVTDEEIGATGVKAALTDPWNTRFGIYKKNTLLKIDETDPGFAPPDLTGYAYTPTNWPSQSGAYSDYIARRGSSAAFNPDSGVNVKNSHQAMTSAQHAQFGRDRRLVLAPIVNCSAFGASGVNKAPMDAWACILLLAPLGGGSSIEARFEYLGNAADPDSPCATNGLAGGTAGPLVPVLVQ